MLDSQLDITRADQQNERDQSALTIGGEMENKSMQNASMSQIEEDEEEEEDVDLMDASKVKSMNVYEMLQDPDKRLVLTNIRQF